MSPATTRSSLAIGSMRAVDPGDHRAVGSHRLEAGQLARIGAPARDLVQEVDHLRHDRDVGQLEAPVEDREIGVEPLRREQRAARRAADADDALDAQALGLRLLDQRAQVGAMVGVGLAAELLEHRVVERRAAAGAHQHLGDQAAARMRDEVDPRSRRHGADQRQRVGDRARAEGRMIEAVDALAVAREQLAHGRVVQRPELAEGADRVRERAVHQHQHRPAVLGQPAPRRASCRCP